MFFSLIFYKLYTHFFSLIKSSICQTSIIFIAQLYYSYLRPFFFSKSSFCYPNLFMNIFIKLLFVQCTIHPTPNFFLDSYSFSLLQLFFHSDQIFFCPTSTIFIAHSFFLIQSNLLFVVHLFFFSDQIFCLSIIFYFHD